jgi:DNA-binding CsgD family transcriptional regulator
MHHIYQENLEYFKSRGDRWGVAWTRFSQGYNALCDKQPEAHQYLEESLAEFEDLGDRWGSVWVLHTLGVLAQESRHYAEAAQCFQRALPINREIGDHSGVNYALLKLADIALAQRDFKRARHYFGAMVQMGENSNYFFKLSDPQGIARFRKYVGDILYTDAIPADGFTLFNLLGIRQLLFAEEDKLIAAELMWFLHAHAISDVWRTQILDHWLALLEAELPAHVYAAARRRGEASDLDTMLITLTKHVAEETTDRAISPVNQSLPDPLSEREFEVLRLMADGLSNQEIAQRLVVTVGTIKKHLNNVFGKLDVHSRTHAIARARELKLLR